MADYLEDAEFGRIQLRRNAHARYVRLRMSEDGQLAVTLPRFAALRHARELIETSRPSIRQWLIKHQQHARVLHDGDRIGQSHTLRFIATQDRSIVVKHDGLVIAVHHPLTMFHTDPAVQKALRPALQKALQKEARAYLPRRLRHLADTYGFAYERVRFGTQKGRWGSCSSRGTVSLNVGLMFLHPELIDYVLVHELCHTRQMNHSPQFWSLVETCLPDYKVRRKRLKTEQPNI